MYIYINTRPKRKTFQPYEFFIVIIRMGKNVTAKLIYPECTHMLRFIIVQNCIIPRNLFLTIK